ncbi:VOC family protein [Chryseolinea soli]|uniref:VOC family protein n=1 Tax=Chryseolinea soli TaxID=2321403 RepID=A0A385SSK6_9BACT|nr:VOC family protein [Chryseolinea soli]AYB33526.1 VOC family protein [Chryseolinea soli]
MNAFDKLVMFSMAVKDMVAAKDFYADKLGFKITSDYRQSDNHWWVSLDFPGGGMTITLTTAHENMKPGTMKLYLSTPDIQATHRQLTEKGVTLAGGIKDDLYGPGSGVKWFSFNDPDGNQWITMQPKSW